MMKPARKPIVPPPPICILHDTDEPCAGCAREHRVDVIFLLVVLGVGVAAIARMFWMAAHGRG